MNKSFTGKLLAACAIGCMATMAIADGPPVQLHIDAPNSTDGLALLSESGWPLTIEMVVDFPEGEEFPAYAIQPNFPERGGWGFLIFADPDGCLNPPAPNWMVQSTPECGVPEGGLPPGWTPPASDEVYMEFWPDVDIAGVEDHTGNADRQADLLDSAGSRGPELQKWNRDLCVPGENDFGTNAANCIRFGPNTGGETEDGFGFGADDDIPGLVIIAEYGVGRVFKEPDFALSYPIGAVNLAGLMNSVSYDLSDLKKKLTKPQDAKGKPTTETFIEQAKIWAHMNMNANVLRRLLQYDACTGNITWSEWEGNMSVESCDGNDLWRIDGGPAEEPPFIFERGDAASIYLFDSTTYTLKVFLVAGQAPNRLFDEDGDGDVDSADAVAAGYTLLSNQDSISLLQLSMELCWGGGAGSYVWDLDDNGEVQVPIVCPGGPGDISRPPR
jgi:hypothetical protein